MQMAVCATLKAANIPHYDFRNPAPGEFGFKWSEVGLSSVTSDHQPVCSFEQYIEGIEHPISEHGFGLDFGALQKADVVVLVLPCNRSAHLELGYAVGAGKRTAILMEKVVDPPELMYKMVDHLSPNLYDLLDWLGVEN